MNQQQKELEKEEKDFQKMIKENKVKCGGCLKTFPKVVWTPDGCLCKKCLAEWNEDWKVRQKRMFENYSKKEWED